MCVYVYVFRRLMHLHGPRKRGRPSLVQSDPSHQAKRCRPDGNAMPGWMSHAGVTKSPTNPTLSSPPSGPQPPSVPTSTWMLPGLTVTEESQRFFQDWTVDPTHMASKKSAPETFHVLTTVLDTLTPADRARELARGLQLNATQLVERRGSYIYNPHLEQLLATVDGSSRPTFVVNVLVRVIFPARALMGTRKRVNRVSEYRRACGLAMDMTFERLLTGVVTGSVETLDAVAAQFIRNSPATTQWLQVAKDTVHGCVHQHCGLLSSKASPADRSTYLLAVLESTAVLVNAEADRDESRAADVRYQTALRCPNPTMRAAFSRHVATLLLSGARGQDPFLVSSHPKDGPARKFCLSLGLSCQAVASQRIIGRHQTALNTVMLYEDMQTLLQMGFLPPVVTTLVAPVPSGASSDTTRIPVPSGGSDVLETVVGWVTMAQVQRHGLRLRIRAARDLQPSTASKEPLGTLRKIQYRCATYFRDQHCFKAMHKQQTRRPRDRRMRAPRIVPLDPHARGNQGSYFYGLDVKLATGPRSMAAGSATTSTQIPDIRLETRKRSSATVDRTMLCAGATLAVPNTYWVRIVHDDVVALRRVWNDLVQTGMCTAHVTLILSYAVDQRPSIMHCRGGVSC